jgi:WD40 repeat protein
MLLTQNAWEQHEVGRCLVLLKAQEPRPSQEDLRGFEWNFWRNQAQRGHVTFAGHTSGVLSIAFSPDGKRLASADGDFVVRVWDVATGQLARTLKGEVGPVAFSPDGQRLSSASKDGTVKVWDVANGQQVLTLMGHTWGVHSVAFSTDGKRLASASRDKTVKVWDAATGQQAGTLKGRNPSVP